jgi:hypothetical protein
MRQSISVGGAAVLLLIVAVAVRAALLLVYQPVVYPDTATYHTLATQILNFDFREYRGVRPPVYPLLLLLAGQDHFWVWVIQSVLGVAVSLLLYWICLLYTGSPGWALTAGLAHTLALNQLLFEANMLSETLTTFLIVLSVASLSTALHARRRAYGHGAMAGVAGAMATLTRPGYVYTGPLFALLVIFFERNGRRLAALILLAFILPVLGWAAFNKATLGRFSLSTNLGYGLTNHSGRFMEKASDEYATLRDIYLKHREKKIAETGSHAVTIFLARDEMREKTGLDDIALSQELTRLSIDLFARHPVLYLKSVAESWVSFWAAPMYWRAGSFKFPDVATAVESVFRLERKLLLLVNALAIAASVSVIAGGVWRRWKGMLGLSTLMLLSCVLLAASVLQALVEYSENPRYGIPTQSLAVTLVLLAVWDLRAAWKAKSAPAKSPREALAGIARQS